MGRTTLLVPPGFDPSKMQVVKGERLEECPYQYLDYPKHFLGDDKFTFRSLCWWGHHLVFAIIVEGGQAKQCKKNFFDRFHQLAGQGLELSLAPTLWEWKRGEGYTLPITHDPVSYTHLDVYKRQLFDGLDAEDKRAVGEIWASRSDGRCLFVMPTDGDFSTIRKMLGA